MTSSIPSSSNLRSLPWKFASVEIFGQTDLQLQECLDIMKDSLRDADE